MSAEAREAALAEIQAFGQEYPTEREQCAPHGTFLPCRKCRRLEAIHDQAWAAAELLNAALIDFTTQVDTLNRRAADLDAIHVQEKAYSLKLLREQFTILRQIEAGLERSIAADFKGNGWRDPHELPGVGIVEVRRSTERRAWQHDRVRSDWLNAYLTTLEGEIPDPAEIRDAFLKVASVSQYKVTGLRQLGLDAENYCESSPGTPRVVLS